MLVVWHSQTGGTRAMVQAAVQAAGDQTAAVLVRSLPAHEATANDVLAADAVVLATPENLAAISGALKDFFDRSYYPLLDQCAGKPYALLVCAGSDGQSAIAQLRRIALGLRLREVAEPVLVCTHAQTPQAIQAPKQIGQTDLDRCRELGATLAAGLALGLF